MSKPQRQKNISFDEDLLCQLEALCTVLQTNFSTKAKELLLNWKINELNMLKDKAPELYNEYLESINVNNP